MILGQTINTNSLIINPSSASALVVNNSVTTSNDLVIEENGTEEFIIGSDSGLGQTYLKTPRALSFNLAGNDAILLPASGLPFATDPVGNMLFMDNSLNLKTRPLSTIGIGDWTDVATGTVQTAAGVGGTVLFNGTMTPPVGFAYEADAWVIVTAGGKPAYFHNHVVTTALTSFGAINTVENIVYQDASLTSVNIAFVTSGGTHFYLSLNVGALGVPVNWRYTVHWKQIVI